jgi:hypothetical protein
MKSAGLACMILLSVLNALPAEAKSLDLDHVLLEGPGLQAPLEASREEFGIIRSGSSPTAVALRRLFERKSKTSPSGALGPGFELSYHLDVGLAPDVTRTVVHLTLFSYAERAPVMFVPSGQGPVGDVDEIESGWDAFPPALVRNLQSAGMPSESAASEAQATPLSLILPAVVLVGLLALPLVRRSLWRAGISGASRKPATA